MAFVVVDCSVAISWFMSDESDNGINLLARVAEEGAIVPSLWPIEVGNVLLVSERNKRITKNQLHSAIHALKELPIEIDSETYKNAWSESIELAEQYSLSLYDATYLELSLRTCLPLATFDKQLKRAAESSGVHLLI